MERKLIVGILIVAIIFVVVYIGIGSSGAVVSAVGESNIEVQPDLVKVYLNLEAKDKSSKVAKDSLDIISDKVQIALLRLGLSKEEIKMQSYNIYQEYDWKNGEQIEKGFVANQQIVIETKEFDLTAEIVDAAIDNGALVSWINFELSDEKQNEYKIKALEEAGKDANKKAEATASGLGKKLGRLVSVENQEFNYGPYVYFEAKAQGGIADSSVRQAALDIAPRNVDVNARISVKYKLRSF